MLLGQRDSLCRKTFFVRVANLGVCFVGVSVGVFFVVFFFFLLQEI